MCKGKFSCIVQTLSGVPEGSHLGPLLLLICITDVNKAFHDSKCILFADYLQMLTSGDSWILLCLSVVTITWNLIFLNGRYSDFRNMHASSLSYYKDNNQFLLMYFSLPLLQLGTINYLHIFH